MQHYSTKYCAQKEKSMKDKVLHESASPGFLHNSVMTISFFLRPILKFFRYLVVSLKLHKIVL